MLATKVVGAGKAVGKGIINGARYGFIDPKAPANWFSKPRDGGILENILEGDFSPRKLTKRGALVTLGAMGILGMGKDLVSRKSDTGGYISYGDGPARMTNSFTTGSVQAMHRLSNGDYGAFAEMASDVVAPDSGNLIEKVENYGATPDMIRALYNMK